MNKQKKIIIAVAVFILIALGGNLYYTKTATKENKSVPGVTEQVNANQDKELTKKIKKENIVSNGQAYTEGDMVVGTMIIKEGATQEQITAVAEKYASELKAKYKDKKVNVQAVQGGKNVANILK